MVIMSFHVEQQISSILPTLTISCPNMNGVLLYTHPPEVRMTTFCILDCYISVLTLVRPNRDPERTPTVFGFFTQYALSESYLARSLSFIYFIGIS